MKRVCLTTIIVVAAVARRLARAQLFGPKMKKPSLTDSAQRREGEQDLLKQATPKYPHPGFHSKQRYLMIGEIVADAGFIRQTGTRIATCLLEKIKSSFNFVWYFVDGSGRIVRGGVSARIDSAPSGTHFAGAAMKWFLRLTEDGVGMHIGILPGYPASHGCIRESVDGAKLFYDHAKVGTPVDVGDF
jgi:hypothetical protein